MVTSWPAPLTPEAQFGDNFGSLWGGLCSKVLANLLTAMRRSECVYLADATANTAFVCCARRTALNWTADCCCSSLEIFTGSALPELLLALKKTTKTENVCSSSMKINLVRCVRWNRQESVRYEQIQACSCVLVWNFTYWHPAAASRSAFRLACKLINFLATQYPLCRITGA